MRHRVAGVKLGRTPAHRRALLRNLVTALLQHEAVRTTDAKAKELKRWGDRLITLGKQGTLHARRRAAAVVMSRTVVKKLFDELGPRYQARHGGYTRVVKLGVRALDAAIEHGHLTAGDRAPCRLEVPVDQAFGDATSRVALAIARRTGRAPEPVARVLVEHLHDPDGWLELAEAAGPGFVNVRASLAYWRAALAACLAGPPTGPDLGRAAVAVPAGAPARARLVADAVARLLAAAGHDVA